jgi:hypothetical protein
MAPTWRSFSLYVVASVTLVALLLVAASPVSLLKAQDSPTPPSPSSSPNSQKVPAPDIPALPRGKKLVLKNGSFQLVREYRVEGDRVRYYSLDSSQWEQMPAALVDWDATKKVGAEEAQRDAAAVASVHKQEEERRAEPLDIDASLEVAPGIFLPPGERLFVFDGKAVLPLTQAETSSKLAKKRVLEQVLVPIPVIPTRHAVSIPGARAKFRLRNARPEFYMRTADARQPAMELIRAKLRGEDRQIENLDQLFGEQRATRNTLPMQRWEIARGVYRFTLGQALEPGEYALAEIVQSEGMSLYVWDFGVDGSAGPPATKPN